MPPAPTEKLRIQLSTNGRRAQVVVEPRAEVTLTSSDNLELTALLKRAAQLPCDGEIVYTPH